MSTVVIETIKHIETNSEFFNELGIQINLEDILVTEFNSGLPGDIYLAM